MGEATAVNRMEAKASNHMEAKAVNHMEATAVNRMMAKAEGKAVVALATGRWTTCFKRAALDTQQSTIVLKPMLRSRHGGAEVKRKRSFIQHPKLQVHAQL